MRQIVMKFKPLCIETLQWCCNGVGIPVKIHVALTPRTEGEFVVEGVECGVGISAAFEAGHCITKFKSGCWNWFSNWHDQPGPGLIWGDSRQTR